jgi:hypothetical protein
MDRGAARSRSLPEPPRRENEPPKMHAGQEAVGGPRASCEYGSPDRGHVPRGRRVLSGFYMWRRREPSARAVHHAMVADVIHQVHDESRHTYGARRVHARLVLGRKLDVARCPVKLLMRRIG